MTKKIAVICGAGIATSTYMKIKIEDLCKLHNIEVNISKGLLQEADRLTQGADFIVSTVTISKDYGIPVINGLPLIIGINEEETLQTILNLLTQ